MTKNYPPDFQSYQERDEYFRDHADYYTVVKAGPGVPAKDELKSLEEAEKLAKTKIAIGGGRFLIYAVIGSQSAFVKAIQ